MKVSLSVFRKRIMWCCVAIVGVLALIVIQMFWARRGYRVDYGLQSYTDIEDSWTYEDGSPADFSSLKHDAGEATVCYLIPEMEETTTLFYRTHNSYTKVFLEDELIYETDNTYPDMSPGSRWNFITLQPEDAGLTLRMQATAAYSGDSPDIDNVFWGNSAAIILSIMQQKLWGTLSCIAIFLIGLIMIILDIALNYGKKIKSYGIIYLGAFSLCIGGWSLIETNVLQFFVRDTQILKPIDNLFLILMVMPLLLFTDWLYGVLKYKAVRVFCILQIIYLVACIILPLAGVTDWHGLLTIARVFIGIFAVGFIALSVWKNRFLFVRKETRSAEAVLQLAGIVALCGSAVVSLLRYFINDSMDRALLLRFGLLIFILCFAASSLFQTYKLIAQGMEYNNVQKIAYSDALTGLGNRAAYLERLEECVKEHILRLGIVYLDVNNLKKVNDVHGHEQGDILIRTAAEVIEESFGAFGRAYRIGGDEFCVLIDTNAMEGYDKAVDIFRKKIETVNKSGKYIFRLQIAHGFICCEADSMKTIEDAIKTADERMYINKVQLKKNS
ncbi:MAG: diguanylate cyclase [Lachnospiraceae bacterium]|nr:diguanylate cyclase [Lachnospiraceae bacterium]